MWRSITMWLYRSMWLYPRFPDDEDDNITIAKRAKRHNRRMRIDKVFDGMVEGVAVGKPYLAIPKKRAFRWMFMSFHAPEEYHAADVEDHAPWYLVMRYLLVDLPEQLENLENNVSLKSWRNHPVEDPKGLKYLHRPPHVQGYFYQKWGRRIVFSEQAEEEPRSLTGRWLVVAYIWSDSREWLKNVDVRNLVSFGSALW